MTRVNLDMATVANRDVSQKLIKALKGLQLFGMTENMAMLIKFMEKID